MNADRPILVSTTADDLNVLEAIATEAVAQRLVACSQIGPAISSHYRWKGKQETSTEHTCTFKTFGSCFEELKTLIRRLHSYDVPEIIAVNICDLDNDYLAWMLEQMPNLGNEN